MRLLVCGGRNFSNEEEVFKALDQINAKTPVSLLIQGGAKGADMLARAWALSSDIACDTYPAEWAKHGPAAGPIRNQAMIDDGKPDLVVAFSGGRGTADMVRRAKLACLRTIEIDATKP